MYTVGVAAALVSAASWALGSVLWRKVGTGLSAYSMNLVKGLIGSVYLAGALLLTSFEGVDGRAVLFLGVSGVVGRVREAELIFEVSVSPSLPSRVWQLLHVSGVWVMWLASAGTAKISAFCNRAKKASPLISERADTRRVSTRCNAAIRIPTLSRHHTIANAGRPCVEAPVSALTIGGGRSGLPRQT